MRRALFGTSRQSRHCPAAVGGDEVATPTGTAVPGRRDRGGKANACRIHDARVVMNSDSHIAFDVGDLSLCEEIIEETNFPRELVLNYTLEGLEYVLKEGVSLPDCEKLLCASGK